MRLPEQLAKVKKPQLFSIRRYLQCLQAVIPLTHICNHQRLDQNPTTRCLLRIEARHRQFLLATFCPVPVRLDRLRQSHHILCKIHPLYRKLSSPRSEPADCRHQYLDPVLLVHNKPGRYLHYRQERYRVDRTPLSLCIAGS